MRKKIQYIILALILIVIPLSYGHGQYYLCSAENFSNPQYLIDENPATKTIRESSGIPATICVNIGNDNYIESITIDIEKVSYVAQFKITVSNHQLDYNSSDYYEIMYGSDYNNGGETGEVTIDINRYGKYIQIWELNEQEIELNELTINSLYIGLHFAYDDAGNRIGRELIISGTKSAKDLKNVEPQKFKVNEETNILIYPNPTSGLMNFEVINPEMQEDPKVQIKVYSISGSLIREEEYQSASFTIDISDEQNGTYLLDMKVNGKKQHFTIIKQ